MAIYSIDIPIWATAYIRADNPEAALKVARELQDSTLELTEGNAGDVEICGKNFDDPDLPDVSLSPAMTISDTAALGLDCIEEVDDG